jgi:cobalt/nickel transport system ATP-binding protein
MQPEVLLLDEPINALDVDTKGNIADILNKLDLSYIIISHEIDFLAATVDAVYTMQNGRILLDQTVEIHEHVHAHPHGTYPHEHE